MLKGRQELGGMELDECWVLVMVTLSMKSLQLLVWAILIQRFPCIWHFLNVQKIYEMMQKTHQLVVNKFTQERGCAKPLKLSQMYDYCQLCTKFQ